MDYLAEQYRAGWRLFTNGRFILLGRHDKVLNFAAVADTELPGNVHYPDTDDIAGEETAKIIAAHIAADLDKQVRILNNVEM